MTHTNRARVLAAAAVLALVASACGDVATNTASPVADELGASVVLATADTADGGIFDASFVHDIVVVFDPDEYDTMIETYASTEEKEWIEATVTIDGTTLENVGIRLKGNSSLFGLLEAAGGGPGPASGASADEPEALPWLIRFDKYVEGQDYEGVDDLVVRSNNSETSLNEAVALDLLEAAGLASQDTFATAFSVNGSATELRLVVEHLDDVWMTDSFDGLGALYKAESTGDYSYRGDDPDAYDEVFDQEAGKDNADLSPLIEFLDFINTADDATFEAELRDRLDVVAFATYLAMQELIDNFDDIDGPGNNSYLHYDLASGGFTVVAWDHNLAFGGLGAISGGPAADGGRRFGGDRPGGLDTARATPGEQSNVLVERFLAIDEYAALVEQRLEELRASLYDSGLADDVLAAWVDVLGASGLVSATTVDAEAATIAAYFDVDD